jgi:hypothetical protein
MTASLAAVGVLGAEDIRGWRKRVPQLVIAWALPLTAVVLFAATWSDPVEDASIQENVSLETMLGLVLFVIFFLTAALGWIRPRLGMWLLVGCLLILAPSTREPHEFAIGLFWLGLFVTDLVLARRQATVARDLPRLEHHSLPPEPFLSLEHRNPWASWVWSLMSLVLALVILGLWVNARDTLSDLDARAEPRDAEVTSVDTAFDFLDFRVDGKKYETQVEDAADFKVGQTITVRVDPTGQFDPLGPEETDPQWMTFWGPLCAPLFLLAVLLWLRPRRRLRDQKRALADSRPIRAMVTKAPSGAIELLTADGLPFGFCRRVTSYYERVRPDIQVFERESVHEARVFGLSRYGRTVLVEIPSLGMLLVPQTPFRDPFTTRALVRRLFGRGSSPDVADPVEVR